MDFGRQDQKESQIEIPKTPFRPIPQKLSVIYTDELGNQMNQGNWIGPVGISPVFTQTTHGNLVDARLAPSNCNWEAAIATKMRTYTDNVQASRERYNPKWNNVPFEVLLASQEAAAASASWALCENGGSSIKSNLYVNGNYTQPQYEPQPCYHAADDLTLQQEITNGFSARTTCQFAPVTPEKSIRIEHKQVMESQFLCQSERSQERNEQESKLAATGVNDNEIHASTELHDLKTDSSLADTSTIIKDNHNFEREGGNTIDLNKTPQLKPRRKKHRPKVIREGKPRIQKLGTPKHAASSRTQAGKRQVQEKAVNTVVYPTGKRKYVRKNAAKKLSTPDEATGESTDSEILLPTKRSCRRTLNFDVEGQPSGESSKFKSTINQKSETDGQNAAGGKQTVHLGPGIEVRLRNTQRGIANSDTLSMQEVLLNYLSVPEKKAPKLPLSVDNAPQQEKVNADFEQNQTGDIVSAPCAEENTTKVLLQCNTQLSPIILNGFNCSTCKTSTVEGQAQRSNNNPYILVDYPETFSTNVTGIQYNALPAYQSVSWLKFPSTCKKKRTEKGQNSTTPSTAPSMTAPKNLQFQPCPQKGCNLDPSTSIFSCASTLYSRGIPDALKEAGRILQHKPEVFGCMIQPTDRSTKERPKAYTQARDLASLAGIAQCTTSPTCAGRQASSDNNRQQFAMPGGPLTVTEASLVETPTKKRTKRKVPLVNLTLSRRNQELSLGTMTLYNNQIPAKIRGAPNAMCKEMPPADIIAERLANLDINREDNSISYIEQTALVPYSFKNEKQNAIVLHGRDDTIIPFDSSFEPIKKHRQRPKVDLDEETTRVWKLLLANINSEGIDGTNEEKAKWWEEERNVFNGRASSFIARMHLVQGDRRFSPWKGSVLDSVIGVFLTQNVSDHLSSSAFMSLAAHFPVQSTSKHTSCHGGSITKTIDEPIVCILEPEDTIKLDDMSNQLICDQSSMTLEENELVKGQEVVNSNESSASSSGILGSGLNKETYYQSIGIRSTTSTNDREGSYTGECRIINKAFSSQNSGLSSQNSIDTPNVQAAEMKESLQESNPVAYNLTEAFQLDSFFTSTPCMELLQRFNSTAESNMLYEVSSQLINMSSDQSLNSKCETTPSLQNDFLGQKIDGSHLTSNSKVQEVEHIEVVTNEIRGFNLSKEQGLNSVKDNNFIATQFGSQSAGHKEPRMKVQNYCTSPTANLSCNITQEDKHMSAQSQNRPDKGCFVDKQLAEFGQALDIMESTSTSVEQQKNSLDTIVSDLTEHSKPEIKGLNKMDAARKAKGRRVGKEIQSNVDWDSLRKQAEANGRKRERTENTMDSLDWEAVRCADVNEIANTIKERGMNNMLAERIKEFLNRLVREHGSIDLEWLRDVPPDKAKEYLLSVRGLGLKSVECVRLLTLHHLAFPVDTNVGRIAVRLGWVPLQPLPESLQLHLLELYPVLESIQRYLWPRLCKLDQRTLYELHYQMITFGKVFCTKSKPNCNACPMRGECRHFASAFASARLALPGPEQRGIVSAAESRTAQNPDVLVKPVPLSLPQATEPDKNYQTNKNQQLLTKTEGKSCCPIIEEPLSPQTEYSVLAPNDIEETLCEDPDEIPTIKLNIEEFTQNLQNYMQKNMELQESDMSKALVALTAEATSIPTPKLKNVSRLRTEHQVYELPDSHPLLQRLDRREPDDPCSYLLAIWTPGETADSILAPENKCNSQEYGQLCEETTCFSCNSLREANCQIVRGTLLIPCRTAMRGSFPLNGTYFQVNEVFADHESSLNPIDVPRAWIWNLPRRTVYFGTSVPTIFKGMTTEAIQQCFWRGYVCVRGFDQKTRAPRPLMARLHFPASKFAKTKVKKADG
ncbi:hypothetical protein K2173_001985 [Erythroxylum novogranatense]|uniref:HhH-GPD domain-containing protein n=1 Tax=Erythroxylum novogranatense TaxID=1862640 RepID=A0AAV8SP54_9ROSI|nr:hypothetical protein K2173_001985 [Erythroxylum novogranatense]